MDREERLDEVITEYLKTVEAGGNIDPADWLSRYPDLADDLREFLSKKFAKWQLPDDFVFVIELPHTSTGKLLKTAMRERYKDWYTQ